MQRNIFRIDLLIAANMKIFIVIFVGLVVASQAHHAGNSVDLNSVTVCAVLNNIYRTFSNIWEVYSEFKATGQLWLPVAPNACPITYVDCPTLTPVCALSADKVYKTFINKCVLDAEQKATGISWNILLNGVCPAHSSAGFPSENTGNYNAASMATHSPSSVDSENYSSVNYGESTLNRNSLEQAANLASSLLSGNSNRNAVHAQAGHDSAKSHSSSSYDGSSLPKTGQQPQHLPNYREPIQSDKNSAQYLASAVNSPLSGNSHQAAAQFRVGESSLSSHSLSSYESGQQSEHLPHYPEPIQPLANDQFKKNSQQTRLYGNSNQFAHQSQTEQDSLSSHPSSSYDGSSSSAGGLSNSVQQPQAMPSNPGSVQPFANSQAHHNSAHLVTSSVSSGLHGNSNQVVEQSQAEQDSHYAHSSSSYDVNSPPAAGHYNSVQQPQPLPSNAGSVQPFANSQVHQNSAHLVTSSVGSGLHGNSNQVAEQSQAEQDPHSSHSSSSYHSNSPPAAGHYNSVQQPQSLPISAQLPTNPANSPLYGNSNQMPEQSEAEQDSSCSHSSSSYHSNSPPAAGHYNSVQQPQAMPSNPGSVQPFANSQAHQNSAHLVTSSVVSGLQGNSNQVVEQSQAEQDPHSSHSSSSYHSNSPPAAGHYNSVQQPQAMPSNPGSVQPFANSQAHQNSAHLVTSSVVSGLQGNSNQVAEQSQAEQASHSSHSSSSYHSNSPPAAGHYNSVQQPQSLPISAQLPTNPANSPLYGNSNQMPEQSEAEQYSSCSHSSSSYHSNSPPAAGHYNSVQQPQAMPSNPGSVQPFANSQAHQNSAHLVTSSVVSGLQGNSNQVVEQSQAEQDPHSSHSSSSYHSNSPPAAGHYNSVQQPQAMPSNPGSVQPFANSQAHQNSAHLVTSSVVSGLQGNSNQVAEHSQAEQASHSAHSSSSYHSNSPPAAGHYNSVQQPQPLPNNPQPFDNSQVHQNSAHLVSSSVGSGLHGNSNQVAEHSQAEQASHSSHMSSSYDGNSPPAPGQYNSAQQPQSIPISAQLPTNPANSPLYGNSNQMPEQSEAEQDSSCSHSSSSYHSNSPPEAGHYNSVQQPQPLPNNPGSVQPFANSQVHQNSAHLVPSSVGSGLHGNSNQVAEQSQAEQDSHSAHSSSSYDGNSPPGAGHYNSVQQPKAMPSNSEPIQQFANNQAQYLNSPISRNENQVDGQAQGEQVSLKGSHHHPTQPISVIYDHSAVLPVPISQLPNAEANAYSHFEPNSCEHSNEAAAAPTESAENNAGIADTAACSNAQAYKSPEVESHSLATSPPQVYENMPVNSEIPNNYINQPYSDETSEADHNSPTAKTNPEDSTQNAQNEAQTIYNGVVYQGPYYYEPKYKHVYLGSFNFASAPGTANSNGAANPGGAQHPFEQLLKQLKYVAAKNAQTSY